MEVDLALPACNWRLFNDRISDTLEVGAIRALRGITTGILN